MYLQFCLCILLSEVVAAYRRNHSTTLTRWFYQRVESDAEQQITNCAVDTCTGTAVETFFLRIKPSLCSLCSIITKHLTAGDYFISIALEKKKILNGLITFAGKKGKITVLLHKVAEILEGSFPSELLFHPVGIEWLAGNRA